ncbi:MAG: 3'(2'),5'-bisphosphate nucleotidase CysQ [Bacteroidales bacterium]|nr:3'(2'),5'-bisphosphate nucleotidase CysQ [Bacteroidales bacterium]MBN2820217.1 3'(2'),5'-bisphosphate nucleotidase CysQ [Bacteroidales bacterium]
MRELLDKAISVAIKAGKATLDFYGKEFTVEAKSDNSPLTQADKASHQIIEKALAGLGIPFLSEESIQPVYEERKNWKKFWLVDPLDGTKEFIKKSGEFTVNIAVIEDGKPVLGVVYAPVPDILFFGIVGEGAFKLENAGVNFLNIDSSPMLPMPTVKKTNETIVVASKSHNNQETQHFIAKLEKQKGPLTIQSYGSSLKLCMVADGEAHVYPRLGPTMEWDTAASHAIVEAAGFSIVQYPSFKPVVYNKENLLNPFFLVFDKNYREIVENL